ncbi:MAG: hypothetical protein NTW14_10240 [bacterium]|nr:hypothetical protein [bacterium]
MKKMTGMYGSAVLVLLFASMTMFIGCSKDDSSNNSSGPPVGTNQETLTPAVGGNVTYESATVIIPPGSLQNTTTVSVGIPATAPNYTQPTNTAKVGNVYEFGPAGTTFNAPVTISLGYNPADLGNNSANTLTILTYTDSTATPVTLTNVIVNATTHVVTGETMHFSFFFLSVTISGGGGGGDYPVPSGGNPMGTWNFSTVDYDMEGIFPDTIQYNIEVTGEGTLNIGEADWHADFVQNIHTTYAVQIYGQWFTYMDTTITVPTDSWGTYTSSGVQLITTTTGSNTNPGEIGLVDSLTYTAETNRLIIYQSAEFEQYAIDVYEVFTK